MHGPFDRERRTCNRENLPPSFLRSRCSDNLIVGRVSLSLSLWPFPSSSREQTRSETRRTNGWKRAEGAAKFRRRRTFVVVVVVRRKTVLLAVCVAGGTDSIGRAIRALLRSVRVLVSNRSETKRSAAERSGSETDGARPSERNGKRRRRRGANFNDSRCTRSCGDPLPA